MADKKLSELTSITSADIASGDLLLVSDVSAGISKSITYSELTTITTGDLNFADNAKAVFGSDSDLQVYHNGSTGLIFNNTGHLEIRNLSDDKDILLQSDNGSGGTVNYLMVDGGTGEVKLFHYGNQKLATSATGVSVTGDAAFGDNGKAIFGAGNDLQIYHDGFNSYIDDAGAGSLLIRGTNLQLRSYSTNENFLTGTENGAVSLYYDGLVKAATTATGVDVTGTITVGTTFTTELTGNDINLNRNGASYISQKGGGSLIVRTNDGSDRFRLKVNNAGDISFYDALGSSESFFWDASAERLILNTSGAYSLDARASGTTSATMAVFSNSNGSDKAYIALDSAGAGKFVLLDGGNNEDVVLSAQGDSYFNAGNVGIGTSSPATALHIRDSSNAEITIQDAVSSATARIGVYGAGGSLTYDTNSGGSHIFTTNNRSSEHMRLDASGNLFVNQTTTADYINTVGSSFRASGFSSHTRDGNEALLLNRLTSDGDIAVFRKDNTTVGSIGSSNSGYNLFITTSDTGLAFSYLADEIVPCTSNGAYRDAAIDLGDSTARFKDLYLSGDVNLANDSHISFASTACRIEGTSSGADYIKFITNSSEGFRLDASGNLLVGKTSNDNTTQGAVIRSGGQISGCNDGFPASIFNRKTSDGDITQFQKDGSTVGSIGTASDTSFVIASTNTGVGFGSTSVSPTNGSLAFVDNQKDIGSASFRWDDVYATNGTIQTSDANEKQDIAELSDAEQRVAVAAKGLLRKFRWKDAVAEKGDEARTHFGIIAQDLQAAFAAEGLDAGDYAMFIHTTWTDKETGEERSRMGVRYSELLAFIIAAI